MTVTPTASTSTHFPLIADPARYDPGTIDLVRDRAARHHWIDVFKTHLQSLLKLATESEGNGGDGLPAPRQPVPSQSSPTTPDAQHRARQLERDFTALLDDFHDNPHAHGPASIHRFCALRYQLLLQYGFTDPYLSVKQHENAAALKLLPGVLNEIDRTPPASRLQLLLENAFAGNIFDLGCPDTIALYDSGQTDFHTVRAKLPKRPWLVDDLDALAARGARGPHRKAVIFVDNSGADIVLGMIPFARELLRQGTHVILTANTAPALNDVTHEELARLIDHISTIDPDLDKARREKSLELIASGNVIPEIDLSSVSPQLISAAHDADFLVIQGMGRALETNYRTRFTVDTLKIAMIKEPYVAKSLGGKMYDVVCRFEPADIGDDPKIG